MSRGDGKALRRYEKRGHSSEQEKQWFRELRHQKTLAEQGDEQAAAQVEVIFTKFFDAYSAELERLVSEFPPREQDEARSICLLVFLKALRSYDQEMGAVSFQSFLRKNFLYKERIEIALKGNVRKLALRDLREHITTPSLGKRFQQELVDQNIQVYEFHSALRQIISRLEIRQQMLLYLRFEDRLGLEETGKLLGLHSRQRVLQMEIKAIDKLMIFVRQSEVLADLIRSEEDLKAALGLLPKE